MSSKTSVLEPLRVRVRRFQFIMGLGFIALVVGSILSVALTLRLSVRIQAVPVGVLRLTLAVLLENLWVLGVLPVMCYGAARVMELKPWTTGGGAAVAGSLFVHALGFVQNGVNGLWLGGLGSFLSVAAFAGGVVLSARAVALGRAAAAQQTVKSQAKAQERKSEYDEFLLAAEQGAARLEQREAQASTAAAAGQGAVTPEAASTGDGAPTAPPVPADAAQREPERADAGVAQTSEAVATPASAEATQALKTAASSESTPAAPLDAPVEPSSVAAPEERKTSEA
ncbi:hypothetical protein [Comamonas sp. JC664]|uniref:hypothetical protein n=1 Tax=Comamonas sp. JC664 TaxID=2801917 RepID=UPI00174964B0|nr:hypothetical protein [Comamonas sp. JC664]MBL0696921.1 hypothetical protein [Comamonas sp. JC664]GHG81547.1 hypothetical protein GCM10012319_34820 [Comamonas sp. KCTC 72670]